MKASKLIEEIIVVTQGDLNQDVIVRLVERNPFDCVNKATEYKINGVTLAAPPNTLALRAEANTARTVDPKLGRT